MTNFPGIENDNEFYAQHYLAEVFQGDIQDRIKQWLAEAEADGPAPPFRRLRECHKSYFTTHNTARQARTPDTRLQAQREFQRALLAALDLPCYPHVLSLADDTQLPALAVLAHEGQAPNVLVLDVFHDHDDPQSQAPSNLSAIPHPAQYDVHHQIPVERFDTLLSNHIFASEQPPRFVLLLSHHQAVLIDRLKWPANRVLRFQFEEILSRREDATLKAVAILLHRDSLFPAEGTSILQNLDDNAHKHAYRVSDDLKYALRQAIEDLGNEVLAQMREQGRDPFSGPDALNPDDFSKECLRYMYRLLFLFYIEARPELRYVPIQSSDTYRLGYSLEALRELELVRLETPQTRNGTYFHKSLQRLFHLVFHGYEGKSEAHHGTIHSFKIPPLDSHLFDPQQTPTLEKIPLRNSVLQGIIRGLSLTRPDAKKRRGRVSYAQLGINQLGEVYEALLSYRGFFAREDLYEVKKAGTTLNPLETGYFVNAQDLEDYDEEERVYDIVDHQKVLKKHPRGSFIYRMAGRDRQKSASYYTPEVLTQCLVKYSLKERLKDRDDQPLSADEILKLSICEPAMGSAAFLNEAVNQLAEAYLQRKQDELGQRIPHEDYAQELQRVKMHIADHNCYGVDLNPIAVELAEVSLWLNAIHGTDQVPWFGYQLFAGNSLIGARRQVYDVKRLRPSKSKNDLWYNHAPKRLHPSGLRGDEQGLRNNNQIYHFLLPDPHMAYYKDKVVKKMKREEIAAIDRWRKDFCMKPFDAAHLKKLRQISRHIDTVWAEHVEILRRDRHDTEDPLPVWPNQADGARKRTSTREKDRRRLEGLFNHEKPLTSPLMRLKLVMDLWCSLWFWPIDKADLLPTRDQFLHACYLLLGFDRKEVVQIQGDLFGASENVLDLKHSDLTEALPLSALDGDLESLDREMSLAKICEGLPMMATVLELTKQHRFHHWELVFADIFADQGGFDILLGNPPWLRLSWNESGIMGDVNPMMVLKKLTAKQVMDQREEALARSGDADYLREYAEANNSVHFLNAMTNYPLLKGLQANLYKCFLPQSWMLGNEEAVMGLIHPESIYDDPKGGPLRREIYAHLRHHYQFQNEKKLFKEIGNVTKYSLNVYQNGDKYFEGISISNLFHPGTIDACWDHHGHGTVEGIKNNDGGWSIAGHQSRMIQLNKKTLALFAKLYDDEGTSWKEARLPMIHSQELISSLEKFAAYPNRLEELFEKRQVFATVCWDETNAQKSGIIKRQTQFPDSLDQWIISGPHLYHGNPLYKCPRLKCTVKSDYDVIDLESLPSDYIPRTNYIPIKKNIELYKSSSKVPWNKDHSFTRYYRLCFRKMIQSTLERTITPAISPKGIQHIHAINSATFECEKKLLNAFSVCLSIIGDMYIKTTGRSNLQSSWFKMPLLCMVKMLYIRSLQLVSITQQILQLSKLISCLRLRKARQTLQ